MTPRTRSVRGMIAAGSALAALAIAGCSSDDGTGDIGGDGTGSSAPAGVTSYAEVDPDISPKGYAALGCSIHTSQLDLDPGDLINRRDPRQAAYQATWSLLVAAGVWNDEAYGALVEPASALEQVHPQGEWDLVADWRNTVSTECTDLGRVATGPHVYAAYACHIADRLAETAPTYTDVVPNRATPAADEVLAVAHLARAAAGNDDYAQLGRRAGRLLTSRTVDDLAADYDKALPRVVNACAKLG